MYSAPAAQNNKLPILTQLRQHIKPGHRVLEIASGSGTHISHFAKNFPKTTFCPTDIEPTCIASIKLFITQERLENVEDPVLFNCVDDPEFSPVDVILNINMIHISSSAAVSGLFRNAGRLLVGDGLLITYGPYAQHGVVSPESNVRFNEYLKGQNPEFYLRDVDELRSLAEKNGLRLDAEVAMPSNNLMLFFARNG